MRHLPLNLSVLFVATTMLSTPSLSADSDPEPQATAVEASVSVDGDSQKVQYEAGRDPDVKGLSDDATMSSKYPDAEIATMVGEPIAGAASAGDLPGNKEEVWGEISQAISGLNDMVGDEMFRDLRRTESNRMEVRVDLHFWRRVRYETRVDLKNDISNIWHLYVLQYADDDDSTVYFIDDETNKTIDIFSKYQ